MHHPPGRRSVSGTWGSLEATVSMAHAARRRGDPWSGSGAGLGDRSKNIEKAKPLTRTPKVGNTTLGVFL